MTRHDPPDDDALFEVLRRTGLDHMVDELRLVFTARSTAARTAARRTASGADAWVPPGQSVTVGRFTIPDGMVYVGHGLPAASPRGGREPAQIDPSLKVATAAPATGRSSFPSYAYYSYRAQSYAELTPDDRAEYLAWLAAGRPGGVQNTYPLLFLAGLERRIFHDARRDPVARAEAPLLIAEAERLRLRFARDWSIQHNTDAFLSVARAYLLPRDPALVPVPTTSNGYELPVALKIAIGSFAADHRPIPAKWALAWYRLHPDTSLRMPAQRCPAEFDELFELIYRERHGEGLLVRPGKIPLVLHYQPVNGGFRGAVTIPIEGISDISRITAPVKKLVLVGIEAAQQLDSFSRFLATGRSAASLPALSLLPPALAGRAQSAELEALLAAAGRALGEADHAVVRTSELLDRWQAFDAKPTKRDAIGIVRLLERKGFGLEPDPRAGSANPVAEERVVLFRAGTAVAPDDPALTAATALLTLALPLAQTGHPGASDGDPLVTELPRHLPLAAGQTARLRARLAWLRLRPPRTPAIKTLVAQLDPTARAAAPAYLLAVARAGGRVEAAQVAILERCYTALGLTPEQLHRDLHEVLTGGGTPPVTPSSGKRAGAAGGRAVRLDPVRLAAAERSSARVASVLAEVFADAEEPAIPARPAAIPGLDAAHTAFTRALAAAPSDDRAVLDQLARAHGLLLGGAVERINDVAYSAFDQPAIELDGVVELDRDVLARLLADADGQDQTA